MKNYGYLVLLVLALIGRLALAEPAPTVQPENPPDAKKGEAVYRESCSVCHKKGANGAPRLGRAKDWENRLFEWQPLMEKHASEGYLNMPAKGYNPQLSEQDMANAVFFMTEKLKSRQ
jgi:cytochrome c5